MMYKTFLALACVAGLATANPAPWVEDEVTVTNTKTVTSCNGPAPTCSVSSAAPASITGVPSGYTVSTVYSTKKITITSCAATVKYCPARSTHVVTSVIPITTTTCPVAGHASSSVSYTQTTETIYSTSKIVITSCASSVPYCPARSTSSLVAIGTTTYSVPVTVIASVAATPISSAAAVVEEEKESTVTFTNTATVTSCPGGVSCPAITSETAVATAPATASASFFTAGSNATFASPVASPLSFKGAASVATISSVLATITMLFGAALLL